MSISKYYKDVGTFKSFDGDLDDLGSPDLDGGNYTAVFEDIPMLLRPMGSSDKIKRDKKVADKMYWIYCNNMAVLEDYIVTIDSVDYRINSIKNPNSLAHHLEIECEVIE